MAPPGSSFEFAMIAFKRFFKIKTGMEWEKRMDGKPPEPKKDVEGNPLPENEGWFRYEAPTGLLASLAITVFGSTDHGSYNYHIGAAPRRPGYGKC